MAEDILRGVAAASQAVPNDTKADKMDGKEQPLFEGGKAISKKDDKGNVLCFLCERPGSWIIVEPDTKAVVKYSSPMRHLKTKDSDVYIHKCCQHKLKDHATQAKAS